MQLKRACAPSPLSELGCRHRKRGLAVLPTKFGISFTFKPMNQAGALVSIFLDGSVSVAHGGVEMGQGLHTKMCQVTAAALQVPLRVSPSCSVQHASRRGCAGGLPILRLWSMRTAPRPTQSSWSLRECTAGLG